MGVDCCHKWELSLLNLDHICSLFFFFSLPRHQNSVFLPQLAIQGHCSPKISIQDGGCCSRLGVLLKSILKQKGTVKSASVDFTCLAVV